jgi:hypothetical protein
MVYTSAMEAIVGAMSRVDVRGSKGNHSVAHAALVLAERAYADGKSEDAVHLVEIAHRLFGAAFESSYGSAGLST